MNGSKRNKGSDGSVGPTRTREFSPALLRSERVIELGRAPRTSVLFVLTAAGLRLFHMKSLPDRVLDDYAVDLAISWIECQGIPSLEVARNLGVDPSTLRRALSAAGYERLEPKAHEKLAHARAARKFGNRRGRLVRVLPPGDS